MKNYEQFIGIDWSGAKLPITTKSIAVARINNSDTHIDLYNNIRSRMAVADYIGELTKGKTRTLIGIDCNFGYAANIVKKQIGKTATAYNLWAKIDAINHQIPNFFAGNFWTHDDFKEDFWIEGKKPEDFEMPQRTTEIICAQSGYGRPESPFKLIGAKQVGKGGLAGMRLAHQLKNQYGRNIAIYPFDGIEVINEATVVLTEIYPRQFIMRAGMGTKKIREYADLEKICNYFDATPPNVKDLTDHDTDALVSAAGLRYLCGMEKNVPNNIAYPKTMTQKTKTCEGWIFGVGDNV